MAIQTMMLSHITVENRVNLAQLSNQHRYSCGLVTNLFAPSSIRSEMFVLIGNILQYFSGMHGVRHI